MTSLSLVLIHLKLYICLCSNHHFDMGVCWTCGEDAEMSCSRCMITMYCSHKCQVDDWDEHKKVCLHVASIPSLASLAKQGDEDSSMSTPSARKSGCIDEKRKQSRKNLSLASAARQADEDKGSMSTPLARKSGGIDEKARQSRKNMSVGRESTLVESPGLLNLRTVILAVGHEF